MIISFMQDIRVLIENNKKLKKYNWDNNLKKLKVINSNFELRQGFPHK